MPAPLPSFFASAWSSALASASSWRTVRAACHEGDNGYRRGMDDQRLLELMQGLSRSLTPGDLDHTLGRITQAAVEVLPDVEFASITVLHADGRLETVAPTDELLWGVDAAQYELREGPCYEAAADAVHVVSPDLANDLRFPRYAVTAVAAGINAQAGIRLFDAPQVPRCAQPLRTSYRRLRGSRHARGVVPASVRHGDRLCP